MDTPCRAPFTFPETSALLTFLHPQRKAPRDRNIPARPCLSCLPRDDKKQFIISLHCKVIRNQWRFPSSLGFPLSDNSMGGFPLAPACPTHYLTSPHCLSPFQRAQEAGAMKCQRARQARGLLVFGPSCLQTIYPDGWSREGLLSMPLNHSQDPGAWESTCLPSSPSYPDSPPPH